LAYLGRQDEKHDLHALESYLTTVDAFLAQSDEKGSAADQELGE
jgi:hypothetical protein